MAKNKYSVKLDCPFTVAFVIASLIVYALCIFLKGKIDLLSAGFTCHTLKATTPALVFNFKNPLDYVRLFSPVLANSDWNMTLANSLLLLLLGNALESSYGTLMFTVMAAVSALVSGVLTAIAPQLPLTGADPLIFMMIILGFLTCLASFSISIPWIFVFIAFTALRAAALISSIGSKQILQMAAICLPLFISLAGGIAGSLLGFMIAPKHRGERKSKAEKKSSDWHTDETVQDTIQI